MNTLKVRLSPALNNILVDEKRAVRMIFAVDYGTHYILIRGLLYHAGMSKSVFMKALE